MGTIQEHKKCNVCGNKEMISNYNYKTEEVYEICDVCGHYHTIIVTNIPKNGEATPNDWKAVLDDKEGVVGFVFKIFQKGTTGFTLTCIKKEDIKGAMESINNDANIDKFTVTFKDKNGYYQTQIYRPTEITVSASAKLKPIDNFIKEDMSVKEAHEFLTKLIKSGRGDFKMKIDLQENYKDMNWMQVIDEENFIYAG